MTEAEAIAASRRGPVTAEMLAGDLGSLGLPRGATVMVHSSLSSLGFVCGAARSVVNALEGHLGRDGTIVVPTGTGDTDPSRWTEPPVPEEWWPEVRAATPAFDPQLTPPRNMGAVPEALLRRVEAVRSRHPLVSLAALGKRAQLVAGDHSLHYGLGEGSPLARIYDLDGWVLLLGVGYDRNTSLHLSEYRAGWPSKTTQTDDVALVVDGRREWVTLEDYALSSADFVDIGRDLEANTDAVRIGQVGHATAWLMPSAISSTSGSAGWRPTGDEDRSRTGIRRRIRRLVRRTGWRTPGRGIGTTRPPGDGDASPPRYRIIESNDGLNMTPRAAERPGAGGDGAVSWEEATMDEQTERLEGAIEAFLATFDQPAISASRPINALLEIWGLAIGIDPAVAAPVERLLTALVGRELTTASELATVMEDLRLALVERSVTAEA